MNVIWYNYVKSVGWIVDLTDLEDLHIVTEHLTGHLERCYINDLNIWVLQAEDPTELGIFPLKELFH